MRNGRRSHLKKSLLDLQSLWQKIPRVNNGMNLMLKSKIKTRIIIDYLLQDGNYAAAYTMDEVNALW